MIGAFIGFVIALAARIGFGYVEFFAPALPYITGGCVVFGVVFVVTAIRKIRR